MRPSLEGLTHAARRLEELLRGFWTESRTTLGRLARELRAAEGPGSLEARGQQLVVWLRRIRAHRLFVPAAVALGCLYVARVELKLAAARGSGTLAVQAEAVRAIELASAADQRSRELRLANDDVTLAAQLAREHAADALADVDDLAAQAAATERASSGAKETAGSAMGKADEAQRLAALALEDSGGAVQRSRQAQAQAVDAGELAQLALSRSVPVGTVVAWDPTERDPRGNARGMRALPEGWAICDGNNGTPNLAHRFLRGVGVPTLAGQYGEPSRMSEAGFHSHAVDNMVNSFQWFKKSLQGVRKNRGEGLLLLDKGYGADSKSHGAHVHEDANIPAHYTVVYIVKLDGAPRLAPNLARSVTASVTGSVLRTAAEE